MVKSASKQNQRVLIAKDVIKLINSGILNLGHVGYVTPDSSDESEMFSDWLNEGDFTGVVKKCTVCALGAATLASIVRKDNKEKLNAIKDIASYFDYDLVDGNLSDVFDGRTMGLIETAYERQFVREHDSVELTEEEIDEAVVFGADHKNSANRVIAIMQNIIDHKGKFVPSVRYDVISK